MTATTAIILAGGYGRRLGMDTVNHKSLLQLQDGRSILSRMMAQLAGAGIKHIIMVHFVPAPAGLLAAAHTAAANQGLSLTLAPQDPATEYGTLHALLQGCHACTNEEDILVKEGDVVCEDSLLAGVLQRNGTILVVDDSESDDEAMAAEIVDGRVVGLAKGRIGLPEFCGVFLLSHADRMLFLLASGEVDRPEPFYEDAFNLMARTNRGFPYVIVPANSWIEIDTPSDLDRAKHLMARW